MALPDLDAIMAAIKVQAAASEKLAREEGGSADGAATELGLRLRAMEEESAAADGVGAAGAAGAAGGGLATDGSGSTMVSPTGGVPQRRRRQVKTLEELEKEQAERATLASVPLPGEGGAVIVRTKRYRAAPESAPTPLGPPPPPPPLPPPAESLPTPAEAPAEAPAEVPADAGTGAEALRARFERAKKQRQQERAEEKALEESEDSAGDAEARSLSLARLAAACGLSPAELVKILERKKNEGEGSALAWARGFRQRLQAQVSSSKKMVEARLALADPAERAQLEQAAKDVAKQEATVAVLEQWEQAERARLKAAAEENIQRVRVAEDARRAAARERVEREREAQREREKRMNAKKEAAAAAKALEAAQLREQLKKDARDAAAFDARAAAALAPLRAPRPAQTHAKPKTATPDPKPAQNANNLPARHSPAEIAASARREVATDSPPAID
jgi:hypothetical protein